MKDDVQRSLVKASAMGLAKTIGTGGMLTAGGLITLLVNPTAPLAKFLISGALVAFGAFMAMSKEKRSTGVIAIIAGVVYFIIAGYLSGIITAAGIVMLLTGLFMIFWGYWDKKRAKDKNEKPTASDR